MEHVDYRYTFGMTDAELDELLRGRDTGVLSLADGGDAYAVPLGYHYDGESLVLRLTDREGSAKMAHLESTDTATFVVYERDGDASWSIVARGPLRERDDYDETRINREFVAFRLFDEAVDETEPRVYDLEIEELTGRRTEE